MSDKNVQLIPLVSALARSEIAVSPNRKGQHRVVAVTHMPAHRDPRARDVTLLAPRDARELAAALLRAADELECAQA